MRLFDFSAISLSGLCLAHCLLLPVAAAFLPALSLVGHAQWVHAAFVLVAVPLTGLALWAASRRHRMPSAMLAVAALGLAALISGAVGGHDAAWSDPVTVAGSLLLVATHIWNWRRTARCA